MADNTPAANSNPGFNYEPKPLQLLMAGISVLTLGFSLLITHTPDRYNPAALTLMLLITLFGGGVLTMLTVMMFFSDLLHQYDKYRNPAPQVLQQPSTPVSTTKPDSTGRPYVDL